MEKKTIWKIGIGYAVFFVILFTLVSVQGGAIDLKMSEALVKLPEGSRYTTSVFGQIFESVGEFPIYLAIQFVFLTWGKLLLAKKEKIWAKIGVVLCLLVAIFAGIYGFHKIAKYVCNYIENAPEFWSKMFHPTALICHLGCSILLCGAWCFVIFKQKEENLEKWLVFTLILASTMIMAQFFVHIVFKPLCSRERFRAMMVLSGNVDDFTPWYIFSMKNSLPVDAIKDDFRSFPSGHTAAAATVEGIILLPYFFKDMKKSKKWLCIILPFVYTFVVAFSRVYVGAHFTSDVLFGGTLTFASLILSFYVFDKKWKYHTN